MIYESIEYYPDKDKQKGNLCKGEIHLEKSFQNNTIRQSLTEGYIKIGLYNNSDKSDIGYTDSYLMMKDGERFEYTVFFHFSVVVREE